MSAHKLKILPRYFNAVADGSKRFEYRLDDRGYEVGDVLVMREWMRVIPSTGFGDYTGREIRCRVTYLLRVAGLAMSHYAVLSIADVEVTP